MQGPFTSSFWFSILKWKSKCSQPKFFFMKYSMQKSSALAEQVFFPVLVLKVRSWKSTLYIFCFYFHDAKLSRFVANLENLKKQICLISLNWKRKNIKRLSRTCLQPVDKVFASFLRRRMVATNPLCNAGKSKWRVLTSNKD